MRWLAGVLLALPLGAQALDPALAQIRDSLIPLRANPYDHGETRGATPASTVIKHLFRDWIESRLRAFGRNDDAHVLAARLNAELESAKLFCRSEFGATELTCGPKEFSALGFLGRLRIEYARGILTVVAPMGIQCGYDDSAYLYSRDGEQWVRRWESERSNYTEKAYQPEYIYSIQTSPDLDLVLSLGGNTWCTSIWQPVYYKVWRARFTEPKLLLSGSFIANISGDTPIAGRVGRDDVLIESTTWSLDAAFLVRQQVLHFAIEDDQIRRIDPVALRPRDFVDEWLSQPWTQSALWSESAARPALRELHQQLHRDSGVRGDFDFPMLHCQNQPDLWQVGIDFHDNKKPAVRKYFLVRWKPPYTFRMATAGDNPSPDCTEEDRPADEEYRTLFPR